MNGFAARPFAAGSLIGHRAFTVHPDGRLRGPIYPAVVMLRELRQTTCTPELKPSSFRSRLNHHQVAGVHCLCGFYAYTDEHAPSLLRNEMTVDALIEGFGVCTVGDLGFKASKARLVALIDPAASPGRHRHDSRAAHLFPQVRDRYCVGDDGVPVYTSLRAAISAHPLGPRVPLPTAAESDGA